MLAIVSLSFSSSSHVDVDCPVPIHSSKWQVLLLSFSIAPTDKAINRHLSYPAFPFQPTSCRMHDIFPRQPTWKSDNSLSLGPGDVANPFGLRLMLVIKIENHFLTFNSLFILLYDLQWFHESRLVDLGRLSGTIRPIGSFIFSASIECRQQKTKENLSIRFAFVSAFVSVANIKQCPRSFGCLGGCACVRLSVCVCVWCAVCLPFFPSLSSWRKEMKKREIITGH